MEYIALYFLLFVHFSFLAAAAHLLGEWQRRGIAKWHARRAYNATNSVAGGMHNYASVAIKEIKNNHRRCQIKMVVDAVRKWLKK